MKELPADIAAAIEAFDNAARETHEDDRQARAALDAAILAQLSSAERCCDSYANENQQFHDRFTAAEAQLSAALARGERLEKALRPFAAWIDALEPEFSDHEDNVVAGGLREAFVTFGDLRQAREALDSPAPVEEESQGASASPSGSRPTGHAPSDHEASPVDPSRKGQLQRLAYDAWEIANQCGDPTDDHDGDLRVMGQCAKIADDLGNSLWAIATKGKE